MGGRLEGSGDVSLQRLAPLDRAGPDALSVLLAPRYLPAFRATQAGAVLMPAHLAPQAPHSIPRIIVADAEQALLRVAEAFAPRPADGQGVAASAEVAADARLGAGVVVGPRAILEAGVVIGARSVIGAGAWLGPGVVTGEDCRIGPHVVCHSGSRLGDRVVLKAGAVIGGEGFRYLRDGDRHRRVPHLGACVLEDDVEIGSGTCVDRGSLDDTVIGAGTKIDNLVQVAHNVRIGRRCLIMATTGIAGSCRIGDDVTIAGGVGVADHVVIGAGAVIGAKSVVFGPGVVVEGAVVSGYPARPHRAFLRAQAALYRLAPHAATLEALARQAEDRGEADGRAER